MSTGAAANSRRNSASGSHELISINGAATDCCRHRSSAAAAHQRSSKASRRIPRGAAPIGRVLQRGFLPEGGGRWLGSCCGKLLEALEACERCERLPGRISPGDSSHASQISGPSADAS